MEQTLGNLAVIENEPLLDDEIVGKLRPKIKEAANRLLDAKRKGKQPILRFHHDADGIAGALALSKVLRVFAYQQNSAVYSVKDAFRDLNALAHEQSPLVILLDFGMSKGSEEGIKLLRAAGVEVIIIDHHPPSPEVMETADICVTPWEVGGGSKHTAGYIACEIAVACGVGRTDALALAKMACAGDKSSILGIDSEDRENALVLDFLAAHSSFGNSLDFYRKVMTNRELFDSIARQAKESIEEAAQKAMRGMKKTAVKEVEIVTFSLERIARIGEWPPSSKITTYVYERLGSENPQKAIVCFGYTGRSIIIRLNDPAVALGLSANDFAEQLKKTMPDFVDAGGGHAKAGAIRVRAGFVKEVLAELLREAERITRKDY